MPVAAAEPDALPQPSRAAHLPLCAPPRKRSSEGVEAAIGGRLLLWAGALTVVLGVAFFLSTRSIGTGSPNGCESPLVCSGIGLVALGLRLARAGYRVYGQILSGVGLAALYLSVYAAFDFYDLVRPHTRFRPFAQCDGGSRRALGSPAIAGYGGHGRRRRIPDAVSGGRRRGRADHVVLVRGPARRRNDVAGPAPGWPLLS